MPNNETEAIRISRLLTPENRANLLAWVHLAYFAENSAKKSFGIDAENNGVSILQAREYSCVNLQKRSKK
jgi:hypothetical protein